MEITGRIVQDAKVRKLKDDRKVVSFTIALNDYYKPKGEQEGKQLTTYINCAYWMNALVTARLKKGCIVEVSGRLYATAYTASDGEAKASIEFHTNTIKVHGMIGGGDGTQKGVGKVKQAARNAAVTEPADDLPF